MAVQLDSLALTLTIKGSISNALTLVTGRETLDKTYTQSFTNGAGAGQINNWYTATRTLAATTAEDLDLSGSLTNTLGTVVFARVKGIIIVHNTPAASAALAIGGDDAAAFVTPFAAGTDEINVRPGGWEILVARDATGYVVTATTADLLQIENLAAGAISYDIYIFGSTS